MRKNNWKQFYHFKSLAFNQKAIQDILQISVMKYYLDSYKDIGVWSGKCNTITEITENIKKDSSWINFTLKWRFKMFGSVDNILAFKISNLSHS